MTTVARWQRSDDLVATFHHGAIGRINAWFFDTFDRYINFVARHHKRHTFGHIEPGTIVELGAGVGANLDFVDPTSRLLEVEPTRRCIRVSSGAPPIARSTSN